MNDKKECVSCGVEQPTSAFYRNKGTSDKLNPTCKQCTQVKKKQYHRTKRGLVSKMYDDQRGNSKRRGHRMPDYSRDDLYAWCVSQPVFHILFKQWEESGFNRRLIPSVDRIDNTKGYTFDNIQLMTFKQNQLKERYEITNGVLLTRHKPVQQFDLSGNLIAEYTSASIAHRQTGIQGRNIRKVASGERKSAGGYIWKFKEVPSEPPKAPKLLYPFQHEASIVQMVLAHQ